MVLAAGQLNSLDRAFSLIQEYESLFNVKPTLETYLALVEAVSRSNPPQISVLLAVFQVLFFIHLFIYSYIYSYIDSN